MVTITPINNKPRILITGANGLLGQKLLELLLKINRYQVIATGKGYCRLPLSWEGYEYDQLDITCQHNVYEVFNTHKPDLVIHAASLTNVDKCEVNRTLCYENNVVGTQNILEASKYHKSHLIYISTDFVFDGKNGPYNEGAEPNPVNYYGCTKLETENLISGSSLYQWTIIRTNLVYGIANELNRSNIILWVKNSLEGNKILTLVDDQLRTPTLAEDLALGCILAADKRVQGVFNISGKDLMSPYAMAIKTADFFGLDRTKIQKTDSSKFIQKAKRPLRTGLIINKARKILGYEPRSFEEGIAILAKQLNLANQRI